MRKQNLELVWNFHQLTAKYFLIGGNIAYVMLTCRNMLFRQAKMNRDKLESISLLQLSCEKYLSALNIRADYLDALFNWEKVRFI